MSLVGADKGRERPAVVARDLLPGQELGGHPQRVSDCESDHHAGKSVFQNLRFHEQCLALDSVLPPADYNTTRQLCGIDKADHAIRNC